MELTARRSVAEASGKRLPGNNNCDHAFAISQPDHCPTAHNT
jgi:hypothetical protein